MNPRRQKRLVAVVAFVLLLGGAIGAMLYALQQNIDLFYTPSQLIDGLGEGIDHVPAPGDEREIRV